MLTRALAAACLLLAAAPAAALGDGTVTRSGDLLRVEGTTGLDAYTVEESGGQIRFTLDPQSALLEAGPGSACARLADVVTCQDATGIERVEVVTGDSSDRFTVTSLDAVLTWEGGQGDDSLYADPATRRVTGQGGNGRDNLWGGDNADRLDGGPGTDTLHLTPGADDLTGGPGFDTLYGAFDDTLRVSLDDVADDGVGAGGAANAHTDIEDVTGSGSADVIVGSAADNVIFANAGNDEITGGGGSDTMHGYRGDDRLLARDGLAERVDCGDGEDVAVVDDVDVPVDCETLDVSADARPDVDGDRARKPADCDDGNAAVRPGAAEVPENGVDEDCDGADLVRLDRDGDGIARPADCDDTRRDVRPGTRELPGNEVDEDCDGRAAPFPSLGAGLAFGADTYARYTVFTRLRLSSLRRGQRITLTCDGRGCPFRERRRRVRGDRREMDLLPLLRGAHLARGTTLTVRVRDPRGVTKRFRFTMESTGTVRTVRCSSPPDRRVRRC